MKKIIMCLLLWTMGTQAQAAYFFDGNKLVKLTSAFNRTVEGGSTTSDGGDALMLMGYVAGMHDLFNDKLFCPDANVRPQQLIVILSKYLYDKPDRLAENGGNLTLEAFKNAYPCKH